MVFGFGIGSRGSGQESYSLRFPLLVSPGREISIGSNSTRLSLKGHHLELDRIAHLSVFKIYGFASEQSAREFLLKMGAGLVYADLQHRIGFRFDIAPKRVRLYDSPIEVADNNVKKLMSETGWTHIDGDYDGNETTLVPEHKRLMVFTTGTASVVAGTGASLVTESIATAMDYPYPERLFGNPKLKLACEIYSSSFFEASNNARFLTLVMVLEALSPNARLPGPLIQTVRELVSSVIEKKERYAKAGVLDETSRRLAEEYKRLEDRVRNLKTVSVGQRMRCLVEQKISLDPKAGDLTTIGPEIVRIYDIRSRLLHNGLASTTDVTWGLERLMYIVPRVLEVSFRETAGVGLSN